MSAVHSKDQSVANTLTNRRDFATPASDSTLGSSDTLIIANDTEGRARRAKTQEEMPRSRAGERSLGIKATPAETLPAGRADQTVNVKVRPPEDSPLMALMETQMSGQGRLADQDKCPLTGEVEMTRNKVVRKTDRIRPQEMEEAAITTHP